MSAAFNLGENEPLFYLGEFPVRLITLLVAIHSAAMVAVSLLIASGNHVAWLDVLAYSSSAVARGQIWRMLTYAFITGPSIWFLLQMLMLYYFGREVEHGLGWRRFALLYTGLILLGPLLLQAFGYAGIPQTFSGAQEVIFAVFAAFVAMHPGAQFFFGLAARWVFVGLLSISSLQRLADHQTAQVLVLIASSIMAVFLMRRAGFEEPMFGYSFHWSIPGLRRSQSRLSVIRGGMSKMSGHSPSVPKAPPVDPEQEMDRLLDKIGRKGIGSLSAEERASLEQARQAILLRSGGSSN